MHIHIYIYIYTYIHKNKKHPAIFARGSSGFPEGLLRHVRYVFVMRDALHLLRAIYGAARVSYAMTCKVCYDMQSFPEGLLRHVRYALT